MTDNPVQDLIDQLKLMRVELGDVKKRQLTEERLKHLQAALEDNANKIAGVRNAAAQGADAGTAKYHEYQRQHLEKVDTQVKTALRGLSEARTEAESSVLARKRNVRLFMLFSALTGLAIGALLSLIVFDHYLERDFQDTVGLMGLEWACNRHGGFVADQDNGKFCVFEIGE